MGIYVPIESLPCLPPCSTATRATCWTWGRRSARTTGGCCIIYLLYNIYYNIYLCSVLYNRWVLAAVVGAAVLALLTCCVSCFCCPCCCLYSMCKKGWWSNHQERISAGTTSLLEESWIAIRIPSQNDPKLNSFSEMILEPTAEKLDSRFLEKGNCLSTSRNEFFIRIGFAAVC